MKQGKTSPDAMEHAPLSGLILRLSLPTVAAMVATSVYNLADSFFAARLGADAAAAVGVVFSLMAVIQAVEFTVALGGSTWISRLLGEKKEEEAKAVAAATFWLALGAGGVLAVLGWCFSMPIAETLGATNRVLPFAAAYAKPIALSAPFVGGCFALSCILRSLGKAAFSMVGIVIGGFANAVLDPLFMFGFSLGLAGAGWATFVGQGISFCVLLIPFLGRKVSVSCSPCLLPKGIGTYATIIKNGMSSFFRQGLASFTAVVLNRTAAAFGTEALAAMTAAGKVAGLLYSAFLGVGQGYQPVAGYCYGADNPKRMKKAFMFALLFGAVCLTAASAVCFFFADPLIGLFDAGNEQIRTIGKTALQAQLFAMPLIPLGVLANMTVQAADRPVIATLLACLRQGLCFLPFVLLMPRFFGLSGLQLSQPLADGLTFLISLPVILRFFRKCYKGKNKE